MLLAMQEKKQLALLDQQVVRLVAYNAAYRGGDTNFSTEPLLSTSDQPTYDLLQAIAQHRFDNVDAMIRESLIAKDTDAYSTSLRKSLQQAKQTFETLRAAPSYYYT